MTTVVALQKLEASIPPKSKSSRTQQGKSLPGIIRQNEYFLPRDGVDREVITRDICSYLGNDALVRPGNHEVKPLTMLANPAANRFPRLMVGTYKATSLRRIEV